MQAFTNQIGEKLYPKCDITIPLKKEIIKSKRYKILFSLAEMQAFINLKGDNYERHILHHNTDLLSKQQIDAWQLLHNCCVRQFGKV